MCMFERETTDCDIIAYFLKLISNINLFAYYL